MKMKAIVALILCAAIVMAALAGCTDSQLPPESENEHGSLPTDPDQENQEEVLREPGIDFDTAFRAFKPDTIMLVAGDYYTVTWGELFAFLHTGISVNVDEFSGPPDWNSYAQPGLTYAEMIMNYSLEDILYFKALEHGAALVGAELNPADLEMFSQYVDSMVAQAGSVEDLVQMLWEYSGIYSLDLFEYFINTEFLMSKIVVQLYGQDAQFVMDDQVAEVAQDGGYLMAMHILRAKPDDGEDGDPVEDLDEILEMLDSYSGQDFTAYFSELMNEHSHDVGGLSAHPFGYLFQFGDMFPEFYEAVLALEIGQYSRIVETVHGYHIILRLPVNYDLVPVSASMVGDTRTLRHIAAFEMFEPIMEQWRESLTPTFTDQFESINFAEIFQWRE